jgi:NitT/TauT family transport system substrate-binding protein
MYPLSRSLFVLLLALAGVAGSAQAQQLLRLGTNVWPGYEPLYIAADREDWERNIRVRLVEYPSASEVLRAFRNKALEAAALTLDEVLALRDTGLPLKVVAVLDISAGGDVILGKPDLEDFEDLRGRRIGVESGALGAYVITRALELNRMTLADVKVGHGAVSAQEAAYLADQVDAVVTFEPVKTRLLAAGARELFSSREIPGEIVDVLVVHEESTRREPEQIRALIASWFRTLDYRARHPVEAAEFTARRLKISPQEVLESYQGLHLPDEAENRRLLGGGLKKTLLRLQETLLREGLVSTDAPADGLLEPGLLPP